MFKLGLRVSDSGIKKSLSLLLSDFDEKKEQIVHLEIAELFSAIFDKQKGFKERVYFLIDNLMENCDYTQLICF